MSSLQSNIKSLEGKITKCTENEQKALAECKTLQEAVKNANALESSLREKDNHIKELESEVCSCPTLANDVSGSGPIHNDSRLYLKTLISKNAFSKTFCSQAFQSFLLSRWQQRKPLSFLVVFFLFSCGQNAKRYNDFIYFSFHTINQCFLT